MTNLGYRTEEFSGSGVRDLHQIILFEVCELGNVDILLHILYKYKLSDWLQDIIQGVIGLCGDGDIIPESFAGWMINEILTEISPTRKLKFGLWLTDKESVCRIYCGDCTNIDAYKISDFVLSDLGPDGKLYGFFDFPKPLTGFML